MTLDLKISLKKGQIEKDSLHFFVLSSCHFVVENFSKHGQPWQSVCYGTKGLMSKTIALHVHYKSQTFLFHSLHNKNVKGLIPSYFEEKE